MVTYSVREINGRFVSSLSVFVEGTSHQWQVNSPYAEISYRQAAGTEDTPFTYRRYCLHG